MVQLADVFQNDQPFIKDTTGDIEYILQTNSYKGWFEVPQHLTVSPGFYRVEFRDGSKWNIHVHHVRYQTPGHRIADFTSTTGPLL